MKDFGNKLAVITGTGTGIGRELALQLASEGCHLAICDVLIENMAVMTRKHLILYVTIRDPALQEIIHPDDISMDTIARSVSARPA